MKTIEEKIEKKEKELRKLRFEKHFIDVKRAIEASNKCFNAINEIKKTKFPIGGVVNPMPKYDNPPKPPKGRTVDGEIKEPVNYKCSIYDGIIKYTYDLTIPEHITGAITHLESMKGGTQTSVFVKIIDKLKKKQ